MKQNGETYDRQAIARSPDGGLLSTIYKRAGDCKRKIKSQVCNYHCCRSDCGRGKAIGDDDGLLRAKIAGLRAKMPNKQIETASIEEKKQALLFAGSNQSYWWSLTPVELKTQFQRFVRVIEVDRQSHSAKVTLWV